MIFRPTDYAPAIEYLLKRPVPNRHIITFLRAAQPGEPEVYTDDPTRPVGVMLLTDSRLPEPQAGEAMACRDVDVDADTENAFERLVDSLDGGCYRFTFTRPWMIPLLWRRFEKISLTRSYYMKVTREKFVNRASLEHAENVRELREADRSIVEAYPEDNPSLRKMFDYTMAKWRGGERALRMLGMFDSGRLAAWVQFWMGPGLAEVTNIQAHPDFRRRGCAAMLLSVAVIAIFKDHDVAYYTAPDDNKPSVRLARSVGFSRESCMYYFLGTRRKARRGPGE